MKTIVRNALIIGLTALFLSIPLFGQSGGTLDDMLAGLQRSFAAADTAAYARFFAPEIREKEVAVVSTFLDVWKMKSVLFHRAVREDREGEPGQYLQVLYESDDSALLETWHVWLRNTDSGWIIEKKEVPGAPTSLLKIRIPSDRMERAASVEIRHQDIIMTFKDAWVFYDNIPDQETALLIIGRGELHFAPSNGTEKHQLELRYGRSFLEDELESAYLRFSDSFFRSNITIRKAPPEKTPPSSKAEANRAYSLFKKYYPSSFTIENSLNGELLSFIPQGDQALFELQTKELGALAYIYSPFDEEQVSLINRKQDKIINLYSPQKEGESGKRMFLSFAERFDVQRYDLEVDFDPEKLYLSCRARIQIRASVGSIDGIRLVINPGLSILRVYDEDGRELFYTQDKLRRLIYVYFLRPVERNALASVDIYYRGKLSPPDQTTDVAVAGQYNESYPLVPRRIDSYLYSQSAYWYPAPPGDDYFQAKLVFSVPPEYACIANGELVERGTVDSVRRVLSLQKVGNSLFGFETKFPVKYLSFVVGRFKGVPDAGGTDTPAIRGFFSEDIRSTRRGLLEDAREILDVYQSWFGPYPYEGLTVVERLWLTSGGHSPASFVLLNELPRTAASVLVPNPESPVDLSRWKDYFLAHEIAHQWWGQAVTWGSYHDQWLSEGLAQFAAVFYLRSKFGDAAYADILRKFARGTEKRSPWGPIILGSRLSYLDFLAYQAIIYNKSTVVLNMLRELLGDETFFRGLRQFYETYKYQSARTGNFIRVMERASGRRLEPFFDNWFNSHLLPDVSVAHSVQKESEGFSLRFRVNQSGDVFVFPLWVEWEEKGEKRRRMLEVNSASQEFEFPAHSRPMKIRIDPDRIVPGRFN